MLIKVSETLFCSGTFLVVCLHILLIHTYYIFSKRLFERKSREKLYNKYILRNFATRIN